jgi:transcription initiation factor IIE alpha subunit
MREMGKKIAYCNKCEKEIFKPKRRSIDSMYYNVWILTIISSLGLALVPFLIYRYVILKKDICSFCKSQLNYYNSREEIPEPKAQIARILQAIEQENQEKENKGYCPFCKQEIMKDEQSCPSCGANLLE